MLAQGLFTVSNQECMLPWNTFQDLLTKGRLIRWIWIFMSNIQKLVFILTWTANSDPLTFQTELNKSKQQKIDDVTWWNIVLCQNTFNAISIFGDCYNFSLLSDRGKGYSWNCPRVHRCWMINLHNRLGLALDCQYGDGVIITAQHLQK